MSQEGRRARRKARAARRNAARSAENVAASQATVSPEDRLRAAIRRASETRLGEERRRALLLLAPHRDPAPDETVTIPQGRAEAQRRLAEALAGKASMRGSAGAQARRDRKEHLRQARLFELEAEAARERQLTEHRRAIELRETEALAKARGVELEEVKTETAEWVRDEHGALARDDRGLPKLTLERATVRRQRHGLDWLLTKGRITAEQYQTGKAAEAVWLSAAQAAEPGRPDAGLGTHACKPSPGPADWRLDAMLVAKRMEASITSLVGDEDGGLIVAACRSVCLEGRTVQSLVADAREQARIEERLTFGLWLIRYWLACGAARIAA